MSLTTSKLTISMVKKLDIKTTMIKIFLTLFLVYSAEAKEEPQLVGGETNVTVVVGRDAAFVCRVENLHTHKVAWLRVDTQTILTIGHHVITKNHRVGVTRGDPQTWVLSLRDVRPSDGGDYMCQINTEPMITQMHHLQVVVPPDIDDGNSSGEVTVREGENVTLYCTASGTPHPNITWRREDFAPLKIGHTTISKWSGQWLNMTGVKKEDNGALLCIATNGVPPSVSKRIILHVLCSPSVRAVQKMIGGYIGDTVMLQCKVEANPAPTVIWSHMDTQLQNETKYHATMAASGYKHTSVLMIKNVSRNDIGVYHCHAENSMGNSEDDITIYTLVTTTVATTAGVITTTTTTTADTFSTPSSLVYEEYEEARNIHNYYPDEGHEVVVVLSQHQMQNLDLSPSL